MDAQTDVPARADGRLSCVNTHSDRDSHAARPGLSGQRKLCRLSGPDRVRGASKGDEECVALRVDLLSAGLRERVSQQTLVLGLYVRVCVTTKLLEELGRSLDVREEEGDGPAREIRHTRAPPASGEDMPLQPP
jgi:hypothetical protein